MRIERPFDEPAGLAVLPLVGVETDDSRVLKLVDFEVFIPGDQEGDQALQKWHVADHHHL